MSTRYRGRPISTLYIRNLSDRVRFEDLKRLFQKYGKVIDVTIPLDYHTRLPKGYCFVQYEDIRDAEEALYRLDRQRLYGKEIEVEFARGDRKTPGEMRSRDRERRYDYRGYDGYDRHDRRSRSRSRDRHRRGSRGRASHSRSRSRSRSYSRNRSASPRNNREKSGSRQRSRSPIERSPSREKSPNQKRSFKGNENNESRSPSPAN